MSDKYSENLVAVLSRLKGVRKQGREWAAYCPVHEREGKHDPSLYLATNERGDVLMLCRANCRTEDIVRELGLTMSDLFRKEDRRPTTEDRRPKTEERRRIEATYDYIDADGALLYQVIRYEGKRFVQRRPDGKGGWIWSLDGTRKVLYNLPAILRSAPGGTIYIPEGEKDVDSLVGLGLEATCNSGGAGKWDAVADISALADRHVVVMADKDAPGRSHARRVAASAARIAKSVKIMEMPGESKDAAEWIQSHKGKEKSEIVALLRLETEKCPPFDDDAHDAHHARHEQHAHHADFDRGGTPVSVNMSDVAPRQVRWLWPGRIALGKITILAGDPGLGKSFITLDIAARVTRGDAFPDCPETRPEPGGAILLNAEDDLGDTIRPRLDAAGADTSRIRALTAVLRRFGEGTAERTFDLAEDLSALEELIRSVPGCRLVVIDPLSAYLGAKDSHKNSDMRSLMAPLASLAAAHNVAIIAVTHLRKGDGPAIYRTMGSLAFVAASRAAYYVLRDKTDAEGRNRLFMPIKNNLGNDATGLTFMLEPDGTPSAQPKVAWGALRVDANSDDVRRDITVNRDGDGRRLLTEASQWLLNVLADGPLSANTISAMADAERITVGTLRRAKSMLKVRSVRTADGFLWSLKSGLDAKKEIAGKP